MKLHDGKLRELGELELLKDNFFASKGSQMAQKWTIFLKFGFEYFSVFLHTVRNYYSQNFGKNRMSGKNVVLDLYVGMVCGRDQSDSSIFQKLNISRIA